MRELKFRAWLKPRWDDDEDANKMYYDIQNSYDTLGNVKPYDPMTSFASWLDDEVAIVEQYTGLKDKNGKEIYEGDIVKRVEDGGFDIVGAVEWSEKAARFWIKRYYYPNGKKWEVIGNIHENPELLGGEE